jgi:hypothetical protein
MLTENLVKLKELYDLSVEACRKAEEQREDIYRTLVKHTERCPHCGNAHYPHCNAKGRGNTWGI